MSCSHRRHARLLGPEHRRWLTGLPFDAEIDWLLHALAPPPSATVLDVPCGQGNFAAAIARRAPDALVIGVDLSGEMLALASRRLRREGHRNAVLIRASALDLPIADAAVDGVLACGGLHLYPDVPLALRETRRVLRDGGRVAGLTFRSHRGRAFRAAAAIARRAVGVTAFDFDALGRECERAGLRDYRWEGRRAIGWFTARAADRLHPTP